MAAGIVAYFGGASCPGGWIEANGQSTAAWPTLADVIGATVPDLRGEFVRGWDHGRGVDPGRTLRSWQMATSQINGAWAVNLNPLDTQVSNPDENLGPTGRYVVPNNSPPGSSAGAFRYTGRPRNVALTACVSTGS